MTPALLATLVATQKPLTSFRVSDRSPGRIPTCTMRTSVAPRNLDPKIVIEPPANVRHSVRIIQPSGR